MHTAVQKALECPQIAACLRADCLSLPEHHQAAAEQKALEDPDAAGDLRRYAAFLSPEVRQAAEIKAMESSDACLDLLETEDLPAAFKAYIHTTLDQENPGWNENYAYN